MSVRKCISALLLYISIIFLPSELVSAQQSNLQKKISGSFTNIPLDNALRKIAAQANVKFSYNPESVQGAKRVTLQYSKKTVAEVLKLLINDPAVSFREIENQIVIYKPGDAAAKTGVSKTVSPDKIVVNKKIPDTVFVYRSDTLTYYKIDTIFRNDTIIRFDTVMRVDTVFIEKHETQKAGQNLKNPFDNNSISHQKFLENNGFFAGISFGVLPGKTAFVQTNNPAYYTLMKGAVSEKSTSYNAALFAGYDYYKVGAYTGLGILQMKERFSYSYTAETGGFYHKDTVETYYTVSGADTNWFYLTDSTWINKETTQFDYNNQNTYTYLDIPLNIKFRFLQSGSFCLYALAGVDMQILLKAKAVYIKPDESHHAEWIENGNLQKFMVSWNAGLGSTFRLGNSMGVMAEMAYRKQMKNQYSGLPVSKNVSMLSLKMGICLNF